MGNNGITYDAFFKYDAKWFSENPTRSFRIRRLLPKETIPDLRADASHVIVKKLNTHQFEKIAACDECSGKNWDTLPDTDYFCRAAWETIRESQSFYFDEIYLRAAALEHNFQFIKVVP